MARWRGAERRWPDLGEVILARVAPHTGVEHVASYVDRAGTYAHGVFCRCDSPVGIL